MKNKKVILVCGPTAVGKTIKAIQLAKQYNCPIISCDSRQVYSELEIGVSRPDKGQLAEVEHHLIAHVSIHENYNAGIYSKEARMLINRLFHTNEYLVVCGGTGLYIKALFQGLDHLPAKNEALRNSLQTELEKNGILSLQEKLLRADPALYEKTEIRNPKRLIRAIEIAGSTKPEKNDIPDFEFLFDVEYVFMNMERKELYRKIDLRVDEMINTGLETEAFKLFPHKHLQALQTVGYKEWWPYFNGETDLKTVIEKIKQHTRNYAKRQITWFTHQL